MANSTEAKPGVKFADSESDPERTSDDSGYLSDSSNTSIPPSEASTPATSTDSLALPPKSASSLAPATEVLTTKEEPVTENATKPAAAENSVDNVTVAPALTTAPDTTVTDNRVSTMPGAFPDGRSETQTEGPAKTLSKGSYAHPSRLRRLFRPMTMRWDEMTSSLKAPFYERKYRKRRDRRIKQIAYGEQWAEVSKGLKSCLKERDELLSSALERQSSKHWTDQHSAENASDMVKWKENMRDLRKHRRLEPKLASEVQYWTDDIKVRKQPKYDDETRGMMFYRSLADSAYQGAFDGLSDGKLIKADCLFAETQKELGDRYRAVETEYTESLEKRFVSECSAARDQLSAAGTKEQST